MLVRKRLADEHGRGLPEEYAAEQTSQTPAAARNPDSRRRTPGQAAGSFDPPFANPLHGALVSLLRRGVMPEPHPFPLLRDRRTIQHAVVTPGGTP